MLSFTSNPYQTESAAMYYYAAQGNFDNVCLLLSTDPMLAYSFNPFNKEFSILDYAVMHAGNLDKVTQISPYLKEKCSINESSLVYLAKNNNFKVLKFLLQQQIIDPNYVYPSSKTLLDILDHAIATTLNMYQKSQIIKTKKSLIHQYGLLTSTELMTRDLQTRLGVHLEFVDPKEIPLPTNPQPSKAELRLFAPITAVRSIYEPSVFAPTVFKPFGAESIETTSDSPSTSKKLTTSTDKLRDSGRKSLIQSH